MKCSKCGSEKIETKIPENFETEIEYCVDCGHVLSGTIRLNEDYVSEAEDCEVTVKDGLEIDWMVTPFGKDIYSEHVRTVAVIGQEVYMNEHMFGGLERIMKSQTDESTSIITDGEHSYLEIECLMAFFPDIKRELKLMKRSILKARKIH